MLFRRSAGSLIAGFGIELLPHVESPIPERFA
jgi:hypothetical protein